LRNSEPECLEISVARRDEAPPGTEVVGEWAASRRVPFKADGTGTADAFVWLTVIDQAEGDEVLLVSANSKDFADRANPAAFAPALLEDLEERGIAPERVRRVANLHQLLMSCALQSSRRSSALGRS
jgi:hypothetical protein